MAIAECAPNEEWRPVEGYVGLYEVSNLGRVRSLPRFVRSRGGGTASIDGRILKPSPVEGGYLQVRLARDGRQKAVNIHRLVLAAFCGPRPPGMETRHLNNDPADNRVENLRWGTRKENAADKELHGTVVRGSSHPMATLNESQVLSVLARIERGDKMTDIARDLGVSTHAIFRIKHGISYRHL